MAHCEVAHCDLGASYSLHFFTIIKIGFKPGLMYKHGRIERKDDCIRRDMREIDVMK
jgi:hypothetical protein